MTSWSVFALELVIISKHVFNNLGLGNAGFCELVLFIYLFIIGKFILCLQWSVLV